MCGQQPIEDADTVHVCAVPLVILPLHESSSHFCWFQLSPEYCLATASSSSSGIEALRPAHTERTVSAHHRKGVLVLQQTGGLPSSTCNVTFLTLSILTSLRVINIYV
jgi:hypothetical protein